MGELNGQILGMVIVIAIFAAITPLLINMFGDLTESVETNIEKVEATVGDINYGGDGGEPSAIKIGDQTFTLLSYAD